MDLGHGILRVEVPAGHAVVTHGEHGTLATEAQHIIKYVQQEYNPVTQKMQAAFDWCCDVPSPTAPLTGSFFCGREVRDR